MNNNQNIRPAAKTPMNGSQNGRPGFVKVRRKLGLTFVLSNPFKVQISQASAAPALMPEDTEKKSKRNPFKAGAAVRAA